MNANSKKTSSVNESSLNHCSLKTECVGGIYSTKQLMCTQWVESLFLQKKNKNKIKAAFLSFKTYENTCWLFLQQLWHSSDVKKKRATCTTKVSISHDDLWEVQPWRSCTWKWELFSFMCFGIFLSSSLIRTGAYASRTFCAGLRRREAHKNMIDLSKTHISDGKTYFVQSENDLYRMKKPQ